ncbi:MAG: class I SAM-dependent methyltransferase [Gemmatimonadota bacterium]|nr:class I SAM-dependent methyltransferase [Gemmatimonadota bacterium]
MRDSSVADPEGRTSKRRDTEVSKPGSRSYRDKKRFYRSEDVASAYDRERFVGPAVERRNRRKWATIEKALDSLAPGVARVIDLPCGTGRFTGHLARRGLGVVGADISIEMMRRASQSPAGADAIGFAQADAERLPFRDDAADCVVSIRFMLHVDPATRVDILREFGRVARYLVVDYRHRYSYRYTRWRVKRALGLTSRHFERVSRDGLEGELMAAGLRARKILPIAWFFSDKWIVVAERV